MQEISYALELLLDGLTETVFTEKNLEHERNIILEEKERNNNDPTERLWQVGHIF